MKRLFRFIPLPFCLLSMLGLLSGCGGGNNGVLSPLSNTGAEQTMQFGSLTTRIAGTAQPPVTSGGSGTVVTGVAGATISSMTLTQPSVVLSQTRIVFRSVRDGNNEIYTMNADGSNQTRLTSNAADDDYPGWSPDGTKIVFHSNRDGNYEIYTMNADGSNQTRLTNNTLNDKDPAWSPDGTKIAFLSNRDGAGTEIYVMNADGNNQTRLTNNAVDDDDPAWSPDGTRIAFASKRDGNYEIYVMSANGGNLTRLTNNAAADDVPSWSPDGTKIVFDSIRDSNYDIYTMNADGSGQTRLTNSSGVDVYAAWSPEGSKLVFSSDRDGNYEIYTMNPDGSNLTRLTTTPANELFAKWSPATTKNRSLIGTNGTLGTTASGFLYGRSGDIITSLLIFDSDPATRANSRVATTTGIAAGLSNYSFTITHPTALTTLSYTNDVYARPTVVIGAGAITASSALVDYNAATGKVAAVIPFESSRSADLTRVEGDTFRHQGKLLGVWNAEGKNIAPGGASEVEVNSRTGAVRVVR